MPWLVCDIYPDANPSGLSTAHQQDTIHHMVDGRMGNQQIKNGMGKWKHSVIISEVMREPMDHQA